MLRGSGWPLPDGWMGRARQIFAPCLALVLSGAADPESAPETLSVDAGQSVLTFHAINTLDQFDATAAGLSGSITLTNARPTAGTVQFPAAQLKTGIGGRDHNMDKPEYLDTDHFRTIGLDFVSLDGPAVSEGRSTGTLHGKLHVKDHMVAVTAQVTYWRKGGRLEVTGGFPLDIRTLGMEPPTVAIVQRMEPVIQIAFRIVFTASAAGH
jgi:polyisoprenoid-binding protein YceI